MPELREVPGRCFPGLDRRVRSTVAYPDYTFGEVAESEPGCRDLAASDAPIAASPSGLMKWRLGAGMHVRPRAVRALTPAAIEEQLGDARVGPFG